MTAKEWKKMGNLIPVFNKRIFTIDTGGDKDCLVILHGYATSSFDYHKVLPELTKKYRVIIHDFVGFGFSEKLYKTYFTLLDQAEVTLALWKLLGLKKITLSAHDFGIDIAQEIIARNNESALHIKIEKIIFCSGNSSILAAFINKVKLDKFILYNGNIRINHTKFLNAEGFFKDDLDKKLTAMLSSSVIFKKTMKEFFFDASKITDKELDEMWVLLDRDNGRDAVFFVHNYIRERQLFSKRWAVAMKDTDIPVRLISSEEDKIIDQAEKNKIAEKSNFDLLETIPKSGHYPMLENPKDWTLAVLKD